MERESDSAPPPNTAVIKEVVMDGQLQKPTDVGNVRSNEVAANALSGPAPERSASTVVIFPPPDTKTPKGGFFG